LLMAASIAAAQNAPGFMNVEIWTPSYAAQRGYDKTFPAPPAPLRSLGGATSFATAGVIISPTLKDEDFRVSLAHGLQTLEFVNVIENRDADPKCRGGGTGFDDPVIADAKSKLHPIEAALRCAQVLHPGSRWQSSHLIAKGDEYVSVIQVQTPGGQSALIHASVTDWAEDVAD
jgi:hypothetical protein